MTPGKYLLPYPAASDIMIFLPLWVRSCMHDTPPSLAFSSEFKIRAPL